jgi:hypothetical protein
MNSCKQLKYNTELRKQTYKKNAACVKFSTHMTVHEVHYTGIPLDDRE